MIPAWFEVAALVVITGILIADLVVIGRRPHVPSVAESARWVIAYIGLALVFAVVLVLVGGTDPALKFTTGWLLEYSLSLDNLFVFMLIMSAFAVPRPLQQRTLMIGILIALVLRGGLILAGSAVIERFTAVFYLFGAILLVTAVSMVRGGDEDEYEENRVIKLIRRVLPVSEGFDGSRLTTRSSTGARMATPMLLVILALGTTDLLFAFDSIPAIFSVTTDSFLVFATNVFALMGLRQLYFLLGGLVERLAYLKYGLAIVLAFIGVKLILEALHLNTLPFINGGESVEWAPELPTWLSLVVIVVALGGAALASHLWPPKGSREVAAAGTTDADGDPHAGGPVR